MPSEHSTCICLPSPKTDCFGIYCQKEKAHSVVEENGKWSALAKKYIFVTEKNKKIYIVFSYALNKRKYVLKSYYVVVLKSLSKVLPPKVELVLF